MRTDCCNFAYAERGGKPSPFTDPSLEEYAAEPNRYGNGTSSAVRASGKENHDVEAAGISERLGVHMLVFTSFLPRSDSPLALPFIGGAEWLCECRYPGLGERSWE